MEKFRNEYTIKEKSSYAMPKFLMDKLVAYAKNNGLSRSEVISEAIEQYLVNIEKSSQQMEEI